MNKINKIRIMPIQNDISIQHHRICDFIMDSVSTSIYDSVYYLPYKYVLRSVHIPVRYSIYDSVFDFCHGLSNE